jgi:hypothetical protein
MAGRGETPLAEDVVEALPKLRAICAGLTPCEEALSYGNPAFKRGKKLFAILDRYKGQSCLWVLVDPVRRDDQLAVEGWFPSPYDPRQLALCCPLSTLDWDAAGALIASAHRLAAA